jgi:hypothetical protein
MSKKRSARIQETQLLAPHIPVPRLHADPRVRILKGLVLQPAGVKSQRSTQLEEPLFIGAHQVDHRFIADLMAVKPNAAVQGEAHPLTTAFEFLVGRF